MSRKQSSATHFYIEPGAVDGEIAEFSREESDHILKTFRLYIGDSILATDGKGNLYQMQLSAYEDRRVLANIIKKTSMAGELQIKITLGFGIPQLSKADQIIDQCTQLGAAEFIPLISKNSKSKLTKEKSQSRRQRWQNVAISAMKQSLRSVAPEIAEPMSVEEVAARIPQFAQTYIGSLRGSRLALSQLDDTTQSILLLTGPEEGFSRIEEDKLIRAGAQPISLGERRLRTELAPVALMAYFSLNRA